MRFFRQGLFGLFVTGLSLALLIWAGALVRGAVQARMQDGGAAQLGQERVYAAVFQTARASTERPVLTAFGELRSRRSLEIRAATPGTIIELSDAFADGGAVTAGDVLLRIDPLDAQTALDRAENDLLDARAEQRDAARGLDLSRDELAAAEQQFALQEKALQRQKDLAERRVGTTANVENAELSVAAARASVLSQRRALNQAEARVDQAATALARAELARTEAQRALDDTVIRAEFTGLLSEVTASNGELVSQNEKLAVLIDPDALDVAFQVSAADYARLLDDEGRLQPRPVAISLDAMGAALTATGQINRAGAAVGEGQTGRQIFARLDAAGGLKPGDFVTLRIREAPIDGVYLLPSAALGADSRVLVLGADQRLVAHDVTLLRRQGDDVILRAEGLEGAQVLRERSPLMGPGMRVRPLNPDDAGALSGNLSGNGPDTQTSTQPAQSEMLTLAPERRARLIAVIEASQRLPEDRKARMLAQLRADKVPADLVARIESRIGG